MPKLEKGKSKGPRIESYKVPPLPEIEPGDYLRDAFLQVNRAELLTWGEIDAFSRLTGQLEPWEAEVIKGMNVAYLEGLRSGEDPFSFAPIDSPSLQGTG